MNSLKLLLAGALLAGIALFSYWLYSQGVEREAQRAELVSLQLQLDGAKATLERERANHGKVEKASREASKKLAVAKANADLLRTQLDGLRSELTQAGGERGADSPEAPASYDTTTLSLLLGECAGAYAGMAEKAEGHARDVEMLLQAWPE